MSVIEREFHRSLPGPTPTDEDRWSLVFDRRSNRLSVRHETRTTGHNGLDEFEIADFFSAAGRRSSGPHRRSLFVRVDA
jgi:hypothetical protein